MMAVKHRSRVKATFMHRGKWWIAWTEDVPGALTQGATLEEARKNLRDAVRMMLEPCDVVADSKTEIVKELVAV